jgi:hypothetical protein
MNIDFKNLGQSKTVRGVLLGIVIVVVVLIIFQAGVFVGFHKASFSFRMGDNYYRNFGGERGPGQGQGLPEDLMRGDLPGGHGVAGKIISVKLPTLVITGPDNLEKVVLVGTSTEIKKFRDNTSTTDLKVNDFVVVLGFPNDQGQIIAKLIRLMPTPPSDPKINFKK